jgi:hypothetical protein
MSITKRWKITIHPNDWKFYIYDNHLMNVLRKLADIGFDVEPKSVTISLEEMPPMNNEITGVKIG